MSGKVHTILIVPERSSQVRRLRIPHRYVVAAGLLAVGLLATASAMAVHYGFVVDQAAENRVLKNENVKLKTRLRIVREEIARIDGTLERIDRLAAKVRTITQLNDPERNLAMGPLTSDAGGGIPDVQYAPGERIDDADEVMDSDLALRMVESQLDTMDQQALDQEADLRELQEYFEEHDGLLSNTPSIRPVASRLVTSTFGMRTDPYTNRRVMHKGIDFAADHGSDVVAPADGVVVFVGHRGEYGKTVVIDHGYGMQTHFGHLSSYSVDKGQQVKRGQVIGAVGKTGRTTGVHLHYEVRLGGIPQDPGKFILN